ncbi:hypothetical protein MICAG_3140002 [Microcystis aeruginosa PCC 9808]|uniref:Uncharacterized protein n=1 Tax=Microcystis aeruginosa PCC 9808 TaxID=1160284 RepID=I4HWZ5_MICAE|nr:hypothetical protein MICAG_3140002 [Microcystis aeruginosa PCC 9808]
MLIKLFRIGNVPLLNQKRYIYQSAVKTLEIPKSLTRSSPIEVLKMGDNTTFSFSSEYPVDRGWGVEILDHAPSSVDLSRMSSANLLFNFEVYMIWYGCGRCANLDKKSLGKCSFLTGELQPLPIGIVSGQMHHVKKWPNQDTDLVFSLADGFKEVEIIITNKEDFVEGIFWDQQDFETIGFFGSEVLILVGYESENEGALVIKWESPYVKGDLLSLYSEYERLDDELIEMFKEDQEELDALPDKLEVRALSLNSLLNHSPMDVRLENYHGERQ